VLREPVVVPDDVRYGDYPPNFVNRTFVELSSGYGWNGFGPGFSGRVGSTFSGGFYVGGSATYYPAESLTFWGDTSPPIASQDAGTLFHLGVEVGYDIGRSPFVLRLFGGPAYGVGAVPRGGGTNGGVTGVAGAHATFDLPRTPLFLSAEARATLTFAEGVVLTGSLGAFGGVGVWIGP
jgi:hypothetical protein